MSRSKQVLLLLGALLLVGAVLYFAYTQRGLPQVAPGQLAGLSGLPAEAGLVVGVDLGELRQQQWLLDIVHRAAGEAQEAPDYRAFVEGTGFDYSRDLDRVWLGVFGQEADTRLTAVAEGRFARDKILAYAHRQGARVQAHRGVDIYDLPPQTFGPPGTQPPARSFAFAFLDGTHMAFASDADRARLIIDCWRGQAESVGGDEVRRAELGRLAAGRQAWAVLDPAKWQPPMTVQTGGQGLASFVTLAALGLRATADGVELAAEARCREAAQASRLHDNVAVLAQLARMTLARDRRPNSQALAQILSDLSLGLEGNNVEARVLIAPATLDALLYPTPAARTTPSPATPPKKK